MIAMDFEYDGHLLSDFGFIICSFDSSDMNTISNGSTLTLNTVPINNGSKYLLSGVKYDECVSATFGICKDVCTNDDLEISVEENSAIMRWLNRKNFYKFKIIEDDYLDIYFESTFNVNRVVINGKLIGYELQMMTNSPFAYKDTIRRRFTVDNINKPYVFIDDSDEVGFIYPEIRIEILEAGDLTILNEIENRETKILGCTKNEIIRMNYPIIESSEGSHNIMDRFNFVFFRIANSYNEKVNRIYFSLPCRVTISYSPICKVVI